ncbi:YkoF family thiamine/hydroxymethylpyrimidine-binding protein [Spirochaeta africana]|uniref:YKOF-like protein n=1 Tax=Spirochaeta africana (strain ATCC 700263 / DSM 8902 / Z-7692) TaxID=889378 RepID=H9ULD6_SPIAZ|nr:YkoF family thiamine/hydroxymethylpyrimidine-binding protein [Spirochaeta africana]AFG38329.1 YKOF-like protein [Spirochaeta africana DSM 8902]
MLVGCQFALYPMESDFIPIILDAVAPLRERDDLRVESDDLSTYVAGPSLKVFQAVQEVYAAACDAGGHVVLSATWSRGCPGEPGDPICTPDGVDIQHEALPTLPGQSTGHIVASQCALYPLGNTGYMQEIMREVELFRQAADNPAADLEVQAKHFCTRLDGELSEVFHQLAMAFIRSGHTTRHVVLTATVSKGSPSASAPHNRRKSKEK